MLGLDIGGANLKAATSAGASRSVPFPLWKRPEDLASELDSLVGEFPDERGLAVTMTGELCDCYPSKRDGVLAILAAVAKVVTNRGLGLPRIWTTAGRFISLDAALAEPLVAAAANWLALATWAGRLAPSGPGLLVDLGSTTCDIVPLFDGNPMPVGRTDSERLESNELVYCGVRRTPLCAIFGLTKAAEFFATTEDVYVALGKLPEAPDRTDTADGRPVTREYALARLARMNCADVGDGKEAMRIALDAQNLQTRRLAEAVRAVESRLPNLVGTAIFTGEGQFLLPTVLGNVSRFWPSQISLHESISVAECAHAVAVLAEESR
jgi:probable H4MPT-linked C1 transfer pathway protein